MKSAEGRKPPWASRTDCRAEKILRIKMKKQARMRLEIAVGRVPRCDAAKCPDQVLLTEQRKPSFLGVRGCPRWVPGTAEAGKRYLTPLGRESSPLESAVGKPSSHCEALSDFFLQEEDSPV